MWLLLATFLEIWISTCRFVFLFLVEIIHTVSFRKRDEKKFKWCWDERLFPCQQLIMLDLCRFWIFFPFWGNLWYQILEYKLLMTHLFLTTALEWDLFFKTYSHDVYTHNFRSHVHQWYSPMTRCRAAICHSLFE